MSNQYVEIVEVGPRDGLQNEKTFITFDQKLDLIRQLQDCGFPRLEVGSFVNPKRVPQMKDTAEIVNTLELFDNSSLVLIPNMKGLELAISNHCSAVTVVLAISNTFNEKNIGKSVQESLSELKTIVEKARDAGIFVRVDIATAFWCPFEGKMELDTLLEVIEEIDQLNVDEIILCDTIGKADPKQVYNTFNEVMKLNLKAKIGAHFHDTYKMGYANVYAALEAGIRIFDTAIAGLGGCPFAPGAKGNVATETVVAMLHQMGFQTNLDEEKIKSTSLWISNLLS